MQARTPLIVVAGALTAVFVLSLLFVREGAARPAERGAGASAPDRSSAGQPAQARDTSAPGDEVRTRAAIAPAIDAVVTERPRLDVGVIRAGTGAPVVDAIVHWWPSPDSSSDQSRFSSWLQRSELEQHFEEAVQLHSDGAGRVNLPDAEHGGFATAVSGDLWGTSFFAPGAAGARSIELAPDVNIAVRVLDDRGEAVGGALVALREHRLDTAFDHWTARTDSAGLAELRHVGPVLRAHDESSAQFVVAVDGLFDPPCEQALDSEAASSEGVTLVLEPSGSCEVVVVDANDQPVGGALDTRLSFADASAAATITSRTGDDVVFERVELGHELTIAVTREASGPLAEVRARGPRSPGERVRVRVPLGEHLAILRGRLLDSTGAPARTVLVRARIESDPPESGPQGTWSTRTSPDGRFTLELAPSRAAATRTLVLAQLSSGGCEIAVARGALPRELGAGSHSLGDFTLVDLPVVAAGRVIAADGRPIAGAVVDASPHAASDGEDDCSVALASARSDEHGAFEIRGESACRELELAAQAEAWIGEPVIVRAGVRDVAIVLGAAAAFEGTLLLDESLRSAEIVVQAVSGGDASDQSPVSAASVDRNGRFTLRELPSGDYALRVVLAATATELASVPHVLLAAGETRRDARLDPLDLRTSHRLIELELTDEQGQPVQGSRAFSRASDEPDARWTFTGPASGRLELLSDGRPLDVSIAAPGFLRCELERVTASRRIVLQRAAQLRLQLANAAALPQPPFRLRAVLTPTAGARSSGFADSLTLDFDERGELACEAAFVGPLRIELMVARRGNGPSCAAWVDEPEPRVIDVGDHAFEQRFEIAVDPARLQHAQRALAVDD